jgi:hypothetical protein
MVKNAAAVLRTAVNELPVRIGGIHMTPENIEQLAVRNFPRIINHLHRFGVVGSSGGYFFVGRVGPLTAGIAGYSLGNPIDFLKIRFHTPETPSGECRRFQVAVHLITSFIIFLLYRRSIACRLKADGEYGYNYYDGQNYN